MKMMTGVLAFLLSANVMATPIYMACITEFPTTSFVALTEGDTINFRLLHHNGTKYMPVWNNVITVNDLPIITETAQVLSDLGTDVSFTLPESSCEVQDGFLINCFGSSPVQEINGHEVRMWAAYTKETSDVSFAGNFNYVTTNVALEVDGKTYHVPMKYGSNECFKGFSSKHIEHKLKTKNIFLK